MIFKIKPLPVSETNMELRCVPSKTMAAAAGFKEIEIKMSRRKKEKDCCWKKDVQLSSRLFLDKVFKTEKKLGSDVEMVMSDLSSCTLIVSRIS